MCKKIHGELKVKTIHNQTVSIFTIEIDAWIVPAGSNTTTIYMNDSKDVLEVFGTLRYEINSDGYKFIRYIPPCNSEQPKPTAREGNTMQMLKVDILTKSMAIESGIIQADMVESIRYDWGNFSGHPNGESTQFSKLTMVSGESIKVAGVVGYEDNEDNSYLTFKPFPSTKISYEDGDDCDIGL